MRLSPIHADGIDFKTSDGKIFKYVGTTEFALFKRWLMKDGPKYLVEPILEERKRIAHEGGYDGPLVGRVMRYAAPPNAFAIDPWSYEVREAGAATGTMPEVTRFTDFCGEHGWYVDWTCGDSQKIPSVSTPDGPRGQQQHLNEFCAALVPCTNAFVETCNEPFQNGIDVSRVVPPQWGSYLRDSGMYWEHDFWQHNLDLDFVSFHSRRDEGGQHPWPKFIIDMFDAAADLDTMMLDHHGGRPAVLKEPIGFDENEIPNRRTNRVDCAGRMGLVIAFCAGVTFHSTPGLASDGFGPTVTNCFRNFCRGIAAGLRV